MPKFMILYRSPLSANDTMAQASPEQMKASMDEWIKWREGASASFNIEFGLPLQAVSRINGDGTTDESDLQIGGYATAEGESKDVLLALLKTHPHLKRPGATIDVLEMLNMPGLDT